MLDELLRAILKISLVRKARTFLSGNLRLESKIMKVYYWFLVFMITNRRRIEAFDIRKIYWIDPTDIKYTLAESFKIESDFGKIIGGEWDLPLNQKEIEDSDIFRAFQERFIARAEWSETDFYRRVVTEVADGKMLWWCESKSDFDKRCEKLDELYEDITKNGYKTQIELGTNHSLDEICVAVGRDGDFFHVNGENRLCIAKIARLKAVPALIVVRHTDWVEFRDAVLNYVGASAEKKAYHPLTHPDLSDIPSIWGQERYEIIKRNLSTKKGTLLDIGAHWGYFCHKFGKEGFDCYAIENTPVHLYFMEKLKRAENRKFKIIAQSIFEYKDRGYFDVVLALNVLHHFLKKKESYTELVKLLRRLRMNELYFQTHSCGEPQMLGAYKNYTPEEFVDFVLENSNLDQKELIGQSQGRPIYKLYRSGV